MQEDIMKSLEALIDESLAEIEELKKSDRFSASEVSIGDSSSGIKDTDKNGKLGKEEDGDDDDDDDDEEKKKKDMDKAEGKNSEADPNAGNHQVVKEEDGMPEGTMAKEEDCEKGEGANRPADPNGGKHLSKSAEDRLDRIEATMAKLEQVLAKSLGEETKEELEKSEDSEGSEELMKSYVDSRFSSLEDKFEDMANLIKEIADAPVPSKSVSYKDVQPLAKSTEEVAPLNKSEIANKLFELKKSGTNVNSEDIASVELGGPAELSKIVEKYNIQ